MIGSLLSFAAGLCFGMASGALARGRLAVEVVRARAAAAAMQQDLEHAIAERDRARVIAHQLDAELGWNARARSSGARRGWTC